MKSKFKYIKIYTFNKKLPLTSAANFIDFRAIRSFVYSNYQDTVEVVNLRYYKNKGLLQTHLSPCNYKRSFKLQVRDLSFLQGKRLVTLSNRDLETIWR